MIQLENKKIIATHYPLGEDNEYKEFIKDPNEIEIKTLFDKYNADIYLYGHTHKQNFIVNNDKYYINPGSLGCPKGSNGASIGILEITNEVIKYENKIIDYDVDSTINKILKLDYPLSKKMIEVFYK